ncbi:hypothetical protein ZIOFF_053259 [Zingiber officinale]|uniref:Protein kinase domain-containing protein n=1 Tax=Zingiber officinale TaxID=94328 RepID=A0A8J5FC46_ZINOF|nr:hypothetical protein ZIOFF_053259 [Zingiber officinale]
MHGNRKKRIYQKLSDLIHWISDAAAAMMRYSASVEEHATCCLSFTVAGLPYSAGIRISPLAPASSPTLPTTSGTMVVSLALIIVALMSFISFKSFKSRIPTKDPDQSPSHKFHILRNSSFCQASGSAELADSINSKFHPSTGTADDSFDMEKPIVFEHEEVLSCSDNFSDVNRLGHGKYGCVYYGVLRDQVAIKRMTVMKTKEFVAEMNVLCKVHHSSLVELAGYATTNDELFLIYEHAHKGSLKNHLHDPQNKGIVSFDKVVLVHRLLKLPSKFLHMPTDITIMDINALDAARAKISDFSFAKLVAKTCDVEASTTKVVGTFGYLAPKYLHDGLATTKSDVYAFGVVLFELITRKEAITKTEGMPLYNSERRSLASIVSTY